MKPLVRKVRRLLLNRGLEVRRLTTLLVDLDEFMAAEGVRTASHPPSEITVLDSEPRIQRVLLRSFASTRIHFHGPPGIGDPEPLAAASGPSWVVLGGAWAHRSWLGILRPLVAAADCLLVRLDPGNERPGDLGLPSAVALASAAGLELRDVITSLQPVPFNAAAHRFFLLFRRPPGPDGAPGCGRRIDEARAFLSRPLATREAFQVLTGRATLGFAGVFNPGTWEEKGRLTVVLRAERLPWAAQERDEGAHLRSSAAVIARLGEAGSLVEAAPLAFQSPLDPARTRTEDYRLFSYRGRTYCSHSLITPPGGRAPTASALRVEELHTRMAISELDLQTPGMRLLGEPTADFELRQTEKNWAFFAAGNDLFVIYSLAPYRVLRARDWPALAFDSAISADVALPFAADGRPVRNSINPVPYDEHHLLHVVHKVYAHKQYVFWALLIDRRTLLPVRVLDRPLARAGASAAAAIVYACSVVVRPNEILVFAGIDDCGSGFWRLDRRELDSRWLPLPAAGPAP